MELSEAFRSLHGAFRDRYQFRRTLHAPRCPLFSYQLRSALNRPLSATIVVLAAVRPGVSRAASRGEPAVVVEDVPGQKLAENGRDYGLRRAGTLEKKCGSVRLAQSTRAMLRIWIKKHIGDPTGRTRHNINIQTRMHPQ